ncbi:MAG TPA: CRTAC1 family protein [Terriglobia bacterium]|nr:CRTAC1 family protein [Terriglobia bacterium]
MLRRHRRPGCAMTSGVRRDRRLMRWARLPLLLLACLVEIALCSLRWRTGSQARAAKDIFTDVTAEAGITWKQFNGESPDRFLIEAMGGGVAFLDFDGDGLLDILFINGGETPRGKSPSPVRNALYRNLGNGRFEDVASKAGVDRLPFYGMGVAAGDYDNDGFPDLYITGYPASALFHNNRNGTFTDVTDKSGVKNAGRWAASAAWFDYDRDGLLDLVVANYVQFAFDDPKQCEYNGIRTYCEQRAYAGLPLTLYRNNGDGTFTDVSAKSGLQKFVGRALGVVSVDVNNDGWPDLFVARDASPNLLLINNRDGTFHDTALDAEVAYDPDGNAKAGMGVDAGDVNEDGWPDFVVTNFNDEYHSLLVSNRGTFPYDDWTTPSHLAAYTRKFVGWGTHFIDYDNDGHLDLMIVNGHINPVIELSRTDVSYKEPPLLLRNNGKAVFENMKGFAGPAFIANYDARGLAVGDFDNDGDLDVVFTCLKDRPVLLRNNVGQDNPWIGFELVGTKSNRDAIGGKLRLRTGGRELVRWITGGSSYLSSQDKRVIFGLGGGAMSRGTDLEITWPSGKVQQVSDLEPNRYHKIVEP